MLSGASDRRARSLATAGMVVTVLLWGTQLPLSQHVLQYMDQYYFGVLRYAIGAVLFALTLWWRASKPSNQGWSVMRWPARVARYTRPQR